MNTPTTFRGVAVVAVAALLAACASPNPTPVPSPAGSPTSVSSPSATVAPTPAPTIPPVFPLAVVTGLTNLKSAITLDELAALAKRGGLVLPCGVEVSQPALAASAACLAADEIVAALEADQELVALLPSGLVEPATKVLPIAGDGPFGLFGPDLFGDLEARAMPYPIVASATGDPALDPAWAVYDPSQIWTMASIGSLCASWGPARAIKQGKGWDWVFGGGTARYRGKPSPGGVFGNLIVRPVDTGNSGVTPSILRRADVALADHECPIVPSRYWNPDDNLFPRFSVPEDVLPRWRDLLGIDVAYLAANHMSDRGVWGIRQTNRLLDKYGIAHTGLGRDLAEALEPAYIEVAGLTVAFVAWNDVGGVARADADTAGVPWITRANVKEGVRQARAGGADLVICDPQWWGGAEYHDNLWPKQVKQLGWFDQAGCDHVIGAGTHLAGPLLLRQPSHGVSLVLASPGNYLFGQGWWQKTQEGVILDMTFRGTTLVNVRFHPYVMIAEARASLLDPEGDGHYVLERVWKKAEVDYTR